jgi:hypothetical protein
MKTPENIPFGNMDEFHEGAGAAYSGSYGNPYPVDSLEAIAFDRGFELSMKREFADAFVELSMEQLIVAKAGADYIRQCEDLKAAWPIMDTLLMLVNRLIQLRQGVTVV